MIDPVCFVCKKSDPDMYTDTPNDGRLWIHEACCITQEEAQALLEVRARFRNKPAEEH